MIRPAHTVQSTAPAKRRQITVAGALLILLLLYWLVSLHALDVTPPVYEDEPWQVSTGWKLASEGVFGSDMFAGHYRMEQRYYGFMPLHPLALAVTFRIAGLGLFQARLEAVVFGLLALCLTFALGKRLFGPRVGLLVVAVLLLVRLLATSGMQDAGIPLLDFARIARYDMAVPVFGLAALHGYVTAMRRRRLLWYGLSGLLAASAGLCHLYGVFFFAALIVLVLWNRDGWRALAALLAGFALPWIGYGVYVLADLPDWVGQTREYGPRFDILNPTWYLTNLRRELLRYPLGLDAARGWLRPGLWLAAALLPLAWIGLARAAFVRGGRNERVLLAPALLLPALFALLITLKLPNYLVSFLPLWALCIGWVTVALWRWAGGVRWGSVARAGLVVAFALALVEGPAQLVSRERQAAVTTPYRTFIAQVRAEIPDGSRVLGLHQFWFGLDDLAFRSWFVPVVQTDPAYHDPPLTAQQAMDAVNPDIILVDTQMRDYLTGPSYSDDAVDPQAFTSWMQENGFVLAASVDDRTYGLMEIYRRSVR